MPIVPVGTWSGRDLSYDTGTQKYIINPNGDNSSLTSLGFSATSATQSELSNLHNGVTIMAGRSDFSGDYNKFPFICLDSSVSLTEPTEFKIYVDRDPDISYNGQTTFDATTYGTSALMTVDAYFGQVYSTTFPFTATFTSGDYKTYTFEINYTDPDTSRSATISADINYTEFASQLPWESYDFVSYNFRDSSTSALPYQNTTNDDLYFTHEVGSPYTCASYIPVGNRTLTDYVNMGFIGVSNISPTIRHIIYPEAQKPCMNRTRTTWNGSGGKGYFAGQGDWTLIFDTIRIGPQDASEYNDVVVDIGSNTRDYFLEASDGTGKILDFSVFINRYNPSVNDFAIVKDDDSFEYLTKPDSNEINSKRVVIQHKYNSGDGSVDVTIHYKAIESDSATSPNYVSATTNITNPHNRSVTNDVIFNGGNSDFCNVQGITNLAYIDGEALNPTTSGNEWIFDYKEFYPSCLNLGDSYTLGVGSTDYRYNSYTNKILADYATASSNAYDFGMWQHYRMDYIGKDNSYTCPYVEEQPAWMNTWTIPFNSTFRNFEYMVNRLQPYSCMLAYTGINYNTLVSPPKAGNPDWGNKTYSEPIWACQQHVSILNSNGIPWMTWNSMPTGGEQDLIDRAQDSTYPWSSFFVGKTLNTYDITNDPSNNGYILSAADSGDGVHINQIYTDLLGAYLYTNIVGTLIPTP
jgi:hypothetical protein